MEDIIKCFEYDKINGRLFWLKSRTGVRAGAEARTVTKAGYARVTVDRKSYPIHHIIWFIEHGYRPIEIDHINQDGLDNRISNLREVSHSENQKNHHKYRSNTSGVTGVSFHKRVKKWEVRIQHKSLGYYEEFEDAVNARKEAEVAYGFHHNHGVNKKGLYNE